jgi:putative glutamine amidotransferase
MSVFRIRAFLVMTIVIFISSHAHSQHQVVLLHPTVSNIENMEWLVENKIIDIPGLELLGVYYEKEAYNYSFSEKYLIEHHLKNYHLLKIEGELKPEDIYRDNSCTPAFRKLVEESDAILFFGGPDIQAALYGKKQNLLTEVTDPNRHSFETSLFFHLIGGSRNPYFKPLLTDKPNFIVRAFCLGMQTMNVAAGGTLLQDIPTELYHKNTLDEVAAQPAEMQHRSYVAPKYPLEDLFGGTFHPIRISKAGYLHEIAGKAEVTSPKVMSYHHQAVGNKGAKLEVIATSMDGKIVEGLQHALFKNVVGVQFHPESSSLYKPEKKLVTIPGSTFAPYELLKSSNSLPFHQLFWKDFSEKVAKSRQAFKN